MSSPFFGLSVVIHVVVIAWHKVVSFFFPNRTKRQIIKPHLISEIFAGMSIVAVLAFVFFSGGTILYASLTEKHSSLYIVERYAPEVAGYDYADSYSKLVSVIPPFPYLDKNGQTAKLGDN